VSQCGELIERARQWLGIVLLTIAALAGGAQRGLAVTPDSPEVLEVIDRALRFLETADDNRWGGKCLIALALVDNGYPTSQPAVAAAVEVCREVTAGGAERIAGDRMYSPGIGTIFLCKLGGRQKTYYREIATLLRYLRLQQKPHGGWGYVHTPTGDTSMTQYGVLSAWVANQTGHGMSDDSVVRVCKWLLRTQDPGGGWGYQGVDPGEVRLVKQNGVSLSLSAAGLGSLLVCADLLGLNKRQRAKRETGLPPALREVVESAERRAPKVSNRVDPRLVRAAIARGNHWFQSNYKIDPGRWTHYYLYALERYMSFRELDEGRHPAEPQWYQDGFRYLAGTQAADGGWSGEALGGRGVNTAFAVLFLSRSTQRSIAAGYGKGTLTGGRGLPSNLVDAQLRRGKIVGAGVAAHGMDLLAALADPDHPDHDYLVDHPELLADKANRQVVEKHADRLRTLVKGGAPEVRRMAVRMLSQTRDLDHVPLLLYALTDPDWRVVGEASDGLRLISRKFEGFGLPPRQDEAARQRVIAEWRKWYLAIRPDAELEN
jgi:hypothetical protein